MNKRDCIINSALILFVERGEQATSMKLIAEQAHCGIGTMYNYFPSKADLINTMYLEFKTNFGNTIIDALSGEKLPKDKFIDVWLAVIDFAFDNPLEYKFLEIFSHSPKISNYVSSKVEKMFVPILAVFEKAKDDELIKNQDTHQLVIFTMGAITASVLSTKEMDENKKKEIALMAWDAIKK